MEASGDTRDTGDVNSPNWDGLGMGRLEIPHERSNVRTVLMDMETGSAVHSRTLYTNKYMRNYYRSKGV